MKGFRLAVRQILNKYITWNNRLANRNGKNFLLMTEDREVIKHSFLCVQRSRPILLQ